MLPDSCSSQILIELEYETIFSTLSPANLARVSSTCHTAYAAVLTYSYAHVNRLLSWMFPSPTRSCFIS